MECFLPRPPAAVNSTRQLCTRHLLLALAGGLRRSSTLAPQDRSARTAPCTLTACSCLSAAAMQEQAQHQHPLPVPRVSVWCSRPVVRGATAFLPERPSQRHWLVTICHRCIPGGEHAQPVDAWFCGQRHPAGAGAGAGGGINQPAALAVAQPVDAVVAACASMLACCQPLSTHMPACCLCCPCAQIWIIIYGQMQSWTPQLVLGPLKQAPPNKWVAALWCGILTAVPLTLGIVMLAGGEGAPVQQLPRCLPYAPWEI